MEQAFELCTILSAVAFVIAAIRLLRLSSSRQYGPFLGLLSVWLAFCLLSLFVPVSSRLYLWIYILVAPISWVFYLFVARDVYQKIFAKFRGIAFAGRWCLYLSAALLVAGGVASVWFSPSRMKTGNIFAAVYFVDRSVLFGLAFFLVLLVGVIVRYPISIQRNLVTHTLVFSGILFSQSICQASDQWTAYRFSIFWNTLAAALDTMFVGAWAILVNQAGEHVNVRIRHHIKPEMEVHLLAQLDSLNGVLLRASRK